MSTFLKHAQLCCRVRKMQHDAFIPCIYIPIYQHLYLATTRLAIAFQRVLLHTTQSDDTLIYVGYSVY
jgi:hypothetical protein